MKCPKCRTANPADSKFCKECATPLPLGAKDQISFTRTLETKADELIRGMLFAGRYEIIEELGAGGMGRVYRAHDTKLNEEVALKLIKPEIAADKKTVERFHNEIKIARKIRHKNVCGVYDFHEEGKALFLTMEYVRGEDLKSFIHRTKTLSVGTALAIARQIAEGLGEAHKLGITHRDLKPGNVMIDKDGQAKVMDFGIARSLHGGGITAEGGIIGTPEYMSPEQVEGKPADPRADIHALGIILFEMVTGRVPFEGETPFSIANKQKSEPPPIPKKLAPQIPEGLNKLILRCLEKDKAKRYQTTEELLADLAIVEDALPTTERVALRRKTITHREVTVKFEPRKLAIPAAALVAIALGGFLLWTKVINPPSPPLPAAKPTLALLAIRNSSSDASLDVWKDNLPTLLGGGLSQSRYLRVLDDYQVYGALKKLNLVGSDKYTPDELKSIGAEAGATHLVSGNFLNAGGKFIVNLSLIDAKTGAVVQPIQEEAPNRDVIYESVDSLVRKVKTVLNIPEQNIDENTYRMVGEIYTRNPKALQFYIEGEKAHQAQDPWKAIPALQKAVELDPGFAMAYRMLGVVSGNQLDFVTKYTYIRKAYELRDKLPERERLLAEGSWFGLREGTHPKAYAAFKKIVNLYPDDYQGRFSMAFFAEDPDERIKGYEYLLHAQNQEHSALLYRSLAMEYCWRGDIKKARETFEESLKTLPPEPYRHIQLALLFQLEKNLDAALQEYEKAVALAPDDPQVKAMITNIDWIKEDHDRALKTLNDILKTQKDPTIFDDYFLQMYLEKGKFREALDLAENAEKKILSLGWPNAALNRMLTSRGKQLLQIGQAENSLEKFRAGLEYVKKEESKLPEKDFDNLIHERRVSLIWQVCALCELGRVQEAEILQRELESLIPEYIKEGRRVCICMNTALPAGKIALSKNDVGAAVKKLEESLLEMHGEEYWINNDHAYLLDMLGDAYQMGGRSDKAAETYARIRELQNGRAEWGAVYARSYYKLGKVFEQMGKKAEAGEKYRRFLDLWKDADAGLPEVEEAKARLEAMK
jgi:serine/threonine protein kinase/predicted Zn-dependent protease